MENYPIIRKIKGGWAAHGNGWAVHAPTKEEAVAKYNERIGFYEDLKNRPFWYDNPDNPDRVVTI